MPKANAKYPFEFKIIEGLGRLGLKLFGEHRDEQGFIVQLNSHGQIVRATSFEQNPDFLSLDEKYESFVLLDVIESGEYIYAKWQDVKYDHLCSLLELEFTRADFIDSNGSETGKYKSVGSVMF